MTPQIQEILSHQFAPEDFSAALDALPIALSFARLDNQAIVYRNRTFKQIFGYEPTEFNTVYDWFDAALPFPEDVALTLERWGALVTSRTQPDLPIEPMEVRILCKNGTIKNILHSGIVMPQANCVVATFVDLSSTRRDRPSPMIDLQAAQAVDAASRLLPKLPHLPASPTPWETLFADRKRQSDALRRSAEMLDRTGRLAGVGGWEVDLINGTVSWTAETHRIHAVPPGYQPALKESISFYAPEARHLIRNAIEQAIGTGVGWNVEAPLIRADGQRIWVRTRGSVEFEGERPIRLIGAIQDVTARVAEQNALKRANERLVLATSIGQIGTYDWDVTNNLVVWDDRMYRILGLDPEIQNASFKTWIERLHPEDREDAERTVLQIKPSALPYENEYRVIWSDGTTHHVRSMGQYSLNEEGTPIRLNGVLWDVTEQRRAANEAQRVLKLDLQMKDDFLSHVSHELRSPLASIYSFANILADGLAGEMTPAQTEYLDIILKNSRQLRSMIEDLLQVTRSETGKLSIALQATSVAEAVTDAVNTVRVGALDKGVTLSEQCSADLPPAEADPTRLRQVLIIILDNATKFTPAGGSVRVSVCRCKANLSQIEVCIADTGCGIEPEAAERIFEHLYQVDQPGQEGRKGLGLGLYIARDLVVRQGGTIWVKSEQGVGSEFRFTLPISFEDSGVVARNPWGVERRKPVAL